MFSHFMMPGISPVLFWSFVGIAVIIQGLSKSGFAGGAGILSLPLMMMVMPSDKVAATLLPLLVLCDLNAVYFHRRNKVWRVVMAIYIPAIFGTIIGALIWWWIGQEGIEKYDVLLKRFIGGTAILFALYVAGKEAALHWVENIKTGPGITWGCGLTAGVFSTIAHAAGPIVGLFIFAQNLGKDLFIGTTAWTFMLINMTKVPFYISVGLIKKEVLLFDLMLVFLIPVGSWLGKWLSHIIPERHFNRAICILTMISGLQLMLNVKFVDTAFRSIFHFFAG